MNHPPVTSFIGAMVTIPKWAVVLGAEKTIPKMGGFHDCFNHKKSPVYAVGSLRELVGFGWLR